jgi:hypothetical protein
MPEFADWPWVPVMACRADVIATHSTATAALHQSALPIRPRRRRRRSSKQQEELVADATTFFEAGVSTAGVAVERSLTNVAVDWTV